MRTTIGSVLGLCLAVVLSACGTSATSTGGPACRAMSPEGSPTSTCPRTAVHDVATEAAASPFTAKAEIVQQLGQLQTQLQDEASGMTGADAAAIRKAASAVGSLKAAVASGQLGDISAALLKVGNAAATLPRGSRTDPAARS